jgi:putative addiction module component (TIGR02574 family)
MIDNALLEKIRNLEPADRLELIGVVWDSLSPTDLSLTDDERDLLDARLADMESNPRRSELVGRREETS